MVGSIKFDNLAPVVDVTLAGMPVGRIVSGFHVTSSLAEKADTCVLELADYRGFLGVEFLETLVTPVRHSEIIEVEGERQFVVKVEYIWQEGGRTKVWYEHAG